MEIKIFCLTVGVMLAMSVSALAQSEKNGLLLVCNKGDHTLSIIDPASGEQLADPVATIASPAPNGSLRIRLPPSVKPGVYYLRALNGHGEAAAHSVEFCVN